LRRSVVFIAIFTLALALGGGTFVYMHYFAPGATFRDCPDCPQMVVVGGTAFLMGSPESEDGRDLDEGPQHTVTLQRFAAQTKQVTRDEFARFVTATNYAKPQTCATTDPAGWIGETRGAIWDGPGDRSLPVACVTWYDAQAYVHWLSQRTGRKYRLLSEAEWEYLQRNIKKPDNAMDNAFGVEDISGARPEWLADCHDRVVNGEYVDDYRGAPADGAAWETESCAERVIRGGYKYTWRDLRPASRDSDDPAQRYDDLGFRVARDLAF